MSCFVKILSGSNKYSFEDGNKERKSEDCPTFAPTSKNIGFFEDINFLRISFLFVVLILVNILKFSYHIINKTKNKAIKITYFQILDLTIFIILIK